MHGVSSSIVATVWQLNCYDRRSRAFVRREVVHYHHLSGLERRHQDFLQISLEDLPRGRALDRQAWTHPSRAHARQERHVRPPVARQRTKGSLSSSRPSVEGCQRGVGGALVLKNTSRSVRTSPATITRHAALRNSSLSLAPTDLFSGPSHAF